MRLVVYKVAPGQVFLSVLLFPLSVSFHQCSILIFIYMLLLLEGQTGEAWKPSKKRCSFRYVSAALYLPVPSHLFFRPLCLLTVMQPHLNNGPQSADSNLAIVYLLPFTMNRESSTLRYKPVHSADSGHMQACSTCYVVPATVAMFGLRAGIVKFNIQN
jgi:hypothetical protein